MNGTVSFVFVVVVVVVDFTDLAIQIVLFAYYIKRKKLWDLSSVIIIISVSDAAC